MRENKSLRVRMGERLVKLGAKMMDETLVIKRGKASGDYRWTVQVILRDGSVATVRSKLTMRQSLNGELSIVATGEDEYEVVRKGTAYAG